MYTNPKPRTIFQSTKTAVNGVADIIVTGTTTTSQLVSVGGKTIDNNLKAMYASTVRENVVENSQEVAESLSITDTELDRLEALLATEGLTTRQKSRIQRQIDMWEATAKTIETTIKF